MAGAAVGLVWWLVAPVPSFQTEGGRVRLPEVEEESGVAADGWFAVAGAVAGTLAAAAGFARNRVASLAVLGALTVGGLLAAVVAWRVGLALGPGPVLDEAKGLRDGARFDGPLQLSAKGVLFAWPLASVAAYFALGTGLERRRPPGSGTARAGERFPTTTLRAGYSIEEVDRFFDGLRAGAVGASGTSRVRFASTYLRRGYDEAAVDAAVEAVTRADALSQVDRSAPAEPQ